MAAVANEHATSMIEALLALGVAEPWSRRDLEGWLDRLEASYMRYGPWLHVRQLTGDLIAESLPAQQEAAVRVLAEWQRRGWRTHLVSPEQRLLLIFVLVGRWLNFRWVFEVERAAPDRAVLLDMVYDELTRMTCRGGPPIIAGARRS